jgi:hypothetical protein
VGRWLGKDLLEPEEGKYLISDSSMPVLHSNLASFGIEEGGIEVAQYSSHWPS